MRFPISEDRIQGVVSGFDRLLFRGSLRKQPMTMLCSKRSIIASSLSTASEIAICRTCSVNRDLYPPKDIETPFCSRGRKLRLLRAQAIIRKIPRTHRYRVTAAGRLALSAILTVDRTSLASRHTSIQGFSSTWHSAKRMRHCDFAPPALQQVHSGIDKQNVPGNPAA